jgi:small subunit ribosomal protein S2
VGSNLTKKERLNMDRERLKLEKSLGGIKDMGGVPDIIFVIDTNREDLAIAEATRLGIPVIGILDSNSSTDNITYPIPGNDDATKSIRLYCNLIADAALDGLQQSAKRAPQAAKGGRDSHTQVEAPEEAFLAAASEGREAPAEAPKAKAAAKGKGKKETAEPAKKERVAPEVVVKKTPRSKKAEGETGGDENAA